MLNTLLAYHPSVIYREKRARRDLVNEAQSHSKKELPEIKSEAVEVDQGEAAKSRDYLSSLSDLIGEVEKKVGEMLTTATAGAKSGVSDADQKTLNKTFQETKKKLDLFAKQTELDGEAPLSGKLSQKPKALSMGDGKDPFELKLDAMHAKGLELEDLRVDSLSYAKKSEATLTAAKEYIKGIQSQLLIKVQQLSGSINSASKDNEGSSLKVKSSNDYLKEELFRNLRFEQEKAARAKGRINGLLINIKV